MHAHHLTNNPFGKTDITVELTQSDVFEMRIAPSNGKRGLALTWGCSHAELDWTEEEIFATAQGSFGQSTYIFSKDGSGYLIEPSGRQYRLNWY